MLGVMRVQVSVCTFAMDFGDKFLSNQYTQKANLVVFFHFFSKLNIFMLTVEMVLKFI